MRTTVFSLVLFTLSPSIALAQGAGSQAEAQALFEAGRKLMDQGKYAEACLKLEASQKLDPGAGTLLNLASCYEKNGQLASAWVTYTDAASASQYSGHPDWAEKARTKAAALAPHLDKITISIKTIPTGLEVKRDGKPIAIGALNTPLPVDPGTHTIEATAPGKIAWSTKANVKGDGTTLEIQIPELADAAGAGTASTETPAPGRGGTQRLLGIALAGAGLVAVGFGVGFGLDAGSKKGVADDPRFCLRTGAGQPIRCNQQGADQISSAQTSAAISTILFVAGAALLTGGGVLFFAAPKGTRAGWHVSPSAPSSLAGLSVGGAW
jgi:hypothetical protein